ncbi:BRO-N domain-containing protein [Streptomyces sp. NPDC002577]
MYSEESLLDSRSVRGTLADRTDVLDDVKRLPLLPDGEHLTAAMLADYFEVDAVVLRRVVRKHAGELAGYGYRQLQGEELKEFQAVNMPHRTVVGRGLGVFTVRTAFVLAMLLRTSEVAHAVRGVLLESLGMAPEEGAVRPTAISVAFPHTGQPVRVVLIDGTPWFATTDLCDILGLTNPSMARKSVEPEDTQTVLLDVATLSSTEGVGLHAGQTAYARDPDRLNVVSEAGLYTLIMKSRKPAAKPFQRWVTAELLPSIRRGDADLGHHQARMAETLADAIGRQVHVVADVGQAVDQDITVLSDGTVRCRHGEMEICFPTRAEDSGPPFGPYYRCPEVERVGIRGSRPIRPCGTIKFVDVVRRLKDPEDVPAPRVPEPDVAHVADIDGLFLTIGGARVHGSARQIAGVLREMGVVIKRDE